MRPKLFSEDSFIFDTNGIGVLYEAIRCDVFEEKNSTFDLELEYPVNGELFKEIKEKQIILAKPNDEDEPHAFRIYEIEKDLDAGVIFARANSITDDLRGNIIRTELAIKDANAQHALNELKRTLAEPTMFDFISDIQVAKSTEWGRINPILALLGSEETSFTNVWGGEIKRTNNTVYLYSKRGRDKVTTIRPGKNIQGFNMTVSNKGIITKVLPLYSYNPIEFTEYEMVAQYDGSKKKEEVKKDPDAPPKPRPDPVTVTGTVVVSPNVDKFPVNYYATEDYSSNDIINDKVDIFVDEMVKRVDESETVVDTTNLNKELETYILSLLNEEAAKYFVEHEDIDEPTAEFKADMFQLADSSDWQKYKNLETVRVGDTVEVYVKKFDVDILMTIMSINYDSIGERVIDIVASTTTKSSVTQSDSKKYEDKVKELEKYIDTVQNGIYNSITRTANGISKRFSGYTEPPASISTNGDLWFREVGEGIVETYIFNGGFWVPIISEIKIQEMEQGITDAKQLAEDARKKAQGTIDEIGGIVTKEGFTSLEDLFASKISDGEYGTLFFQQAKNIGFVYTNAEGEDEAIIMISEGMPYIKGEHIILDGNTVVDGSFTVTETMLAKDAVIQSLTASGIDAKDVRIINLDANSIVGGDLELTNGLRITNNGFPVLEVDAATGQVKITAANLATKKDLEDLALTPGPPGEDAWNVEILSSNGNIFKKGNIQTVLEARVYRGGNDVTDEIALSRFKWTRVSEDMAGDTIWNQRYFGGTKTIVVTPEDVYRRATFFCDILDEPQN